MLFKHAVILIAEPIRTVRLSGSRLPHSSPSPRRHKSPWCGRQYAQVVCCPCYVHVETHIQRVLACRAFCCKVRAAMYGVVAIVVQHLWQRCDACSVFGIVCIGIGGLYAVIVPVGQVDRVAFCIGLLVVVECPVSYAVARSVHARHERTARRGRHSTSVCVRKFLTPFRAPIGLWDHSPCCASRDGFALFVLRCFQSLMSGSVLQSRLQRSICASQGSSQDIFTSVMLPLVSLTAVYTGLMKPLQGVRLRWAQRLSTVESNNKCSTLQNQKNNL